MARKPRRQIARRKPRKPRTPRLPMTKRTVTTRVQFGKFGMQPSAMQRQEFDANVALDAAFTAADDGDCARVSKSLDKAEAAGAKVSLHRKQLMQDCKIDRSGIPVSGLVDDTKAAFKQEKLFNPYTVGALLLGAWLGRKVLS